MDALKSLMQPLIGGSGGSSSVIDGMKLVVLGGTVETARRVSSSAWSHFVNSFFLTAHFSEEDLPYDWLMLWLSRRPEWQRSREFETTTRAAGPGGASTNAGSSSNQHYSEEDADWDQWEVAINGSSGGGDGGGGWDDAGGGWGGEGGSGGDESRPKTRVVFQPTYDTTHTIYYRGHWLRVRRGRKQDSGCEMLSISVVARNNAILKQLVLQAKKEYEAESVHRIQIYFADAHGSWRWTDSRHKRPMSSIVLNPGVKEMLLDDARDFLRSEKWYADRGIPFRRGYLLHGVPGSGKSSLIHALAGQLQLDIYVVSLSASWISDNTLTTLMGRVPARCVLLLEDLDAAFVRSTTREDDEEGGGDDEGGGGVGTTDAFPGFTSSGPFGSGIFGNGGGGGFGGYGGYGSGGGGGRSGRRRYGRSDGLSDMNTLSLSGLLNALDGVAASEGRLLFATTNHLERLDPALSRPGRMDVWVEFKNASRWQAEALFRNFFPSEDEDDVAIEKEAEKEGLDIEKNLQGKVRTYVPNAAAVARARSESAVSSSSSAASAASVSGAAGAKELPSLWSLSTSIASSASSLLSGQTSPTLASPAGSTAPPLPRTFTGSPIPPSSPQGSRGPSTPRSGTPTIHSRMSSDQFGANNTAYLPPPPDSSLAAMKVKPLDRKTLAVLAKKFADGLPEEEFSVAGLQGYLLKHKAQPEAAANGVEAWVQGEREMRERLKREKEAREVREKALREKRKKEAQEKDKAKKAQDKKDKELERVKALLAEKEKEEELEKMRQQLKDKEAEIRKKEEERKKGKGKKGKAGKGKKAAVDDDKKEEEEEEEKMDDKEKEEEKSDASSSSSDDKDDDDEEKSEDEAGAEAESESTPDADRDAASSSGSSSWGEVS